MTRCVAPSMTDTVPLQQLVTYSRLVAESTAIAWGAEPTATVAVLRGAPSTPEPPHPSAIPATIARPPQQVRSPKNRCRYCTIASSFMHETMSLIHNGRQIEDQ